MSVSGAPVKELESNEGLEVIGDRYFKGLNLRDHEINDDLIDKVVKIIEKKGRYSLYIDFGKKI